MNTTKNITMHSSNNYRDKPNQKYKKYKNTTQTMPNITVFKSKHKCPNCNTDFQVQTNTWGITPNIGPQSFAEANERNRHQQRSGYQNYDDFGIRQAYQQKKNLSRLPLLLDCGHTVCEKCIRRELNICTTEFMVKCSQCFTLTVVQSAIHTDTEFYTYFPINYYITGLCFIERSLNMNFTGNQNRFNSVSTDMMMRPPSLMSLNQPITASNSPDNAIPKPICSECREKLSAFSCKECKLTLCNECFGIIHKPKCFSHHKAIPIGKISLAQQNSTSSEEVTSSTLSLSNCTIHISRAQPLEFHCLDCSIDTCQVCVLTTHQGHKITEVAQINMNYVAELKEKQGAARDLKQNLETALKKVELKLSTQHASKTIVTLENEIQEHFQESHGRLQIIENRIRNELNALQFKNQLSLQKAHKQLQDYLKRIVDILNKTEIAKNPKQLANINVATLIREFNELSTHKDELFIEEIDTEAIKLNIDDNFLATIDDHCFLEIDSEKSSNMVSICDLPDESVSPTPSTSTNFSEVSIHFTDDQYMNTNASQYQSDSEISIHSMYLPRYTSKQNFTSPAIVTANTPKKPLVEGTCIRVYLSHIRNPSLFYVQHQDDANNHFELSRQYTQYAKKSKIPEDVTQNEMYFVYFDADKKWYRGLVRKIIFDKSGIENYELFFIDYGNSKVVSIDKLRVMTDNLKAHPPKAYRCSLFDLIPRDDREWTEDATRLMLRLIDRTNINMYIMKIVGDLYFVDLITISKENMQLATSIRDALIFLEHGCFENALTFPSKIIKSVDCEKRKYLYREFRKGDVYDVLCPFVISPNCFFIQLVMYAEYLQKLMTNLQEKYTKNGKKGLIYNPQVEMVCAVEYNGQWFRGSIDSLPGRRQIDVLQVDYGEIVRVEWNQIRVLYEEFRQATVQGIQASLSDVQSVPNKNHWSIESMEYLKEVIKQSKQLKIQINKIGNRKIHVTLFNVLPYRLLNINAELVENGHALSIGINSQYGDFYNLDKSTDVPKIKIKERKPQTTKQRTVQNFTLSHHSTSSSSTRHTITTYSSATPLKPDTPKTIEAPILLKPGEPVRVQIDVLSVLDPECIYVRLHNRSKDIVILQDVLQTFYSKIPYDDTVDWEVGNKCGVCVDNVWYRAIIEDIDNDLIKVFIKDFAKSATVNKKHLRILDESFLTVRDGSIKCQLYGIKAAGDKNTWPMLACEELRELLSTESEIYITKKGEVTENRALPVDFWVYEITRGGALEPSTSKWILINQLLIDRGLVIPIKNEEKKLIEQSLEESSQSIDTITDWLQLADLDLTKTNFVEHWIEAEPLTSFKFRAIITHIDTNFDIYLHDCFDNMLDKIHAKLQEHFMDSKAQMCDIFWTENQPCIVRNTDDNNYYRGLVKEIISNDIVNVLFIDYGFRKNCRVFDLRKNIIMDNIPIQSIKCQLHRLKPVKSKFWPSSVIKFTRNLIIKKDFTIEVKEVLNDDIFIDIYIDSTKTLEGLLVEKKWAVQVKGEAIDSDSSVIIEDSDSVSMIGSVEGVLEEESFAIYTQIVLPKKIGNEIKIEVISAGIDCLSWYIRLAGPIAEQLGQKSKYDDLLELIQFEAIQQPVIDDPQVGQACCALYKEDNQWYRGEIMAPIHKNSDALIVIFADYGNIEQVPRVDVRHMKNDWLMIPMQCLHAKIHGMKINKHVESFETLMDEFTEVLFKNESIANIISSNPLTIEIYNLDGTLKYQSLIDKGLLTPLSTSVDYLTRPTS